MRKTLTNKSNTSTLNFSFPSVSTSSVKQHCKKSYLNKLCFSVNSLTSYRLPSKNESQIKHVPVKHALVVEGNVFTKLS